MVLALPSFQLMAAEAWHQALADMPLRANVQQLNRSNCVDIMLRSFQSNTVVKALIFMPGATDELYLFRRVKANLTTTSPSLLDAVSALTNQTHIYATFHPPFLLLHTDEDPLEPDYVIEDQPTSTKLQAARPIPYLLCNDRDWDFLQPILKHSLRVDLRPWRHSMDSWHFYRHSFAAWNLTGREALETAAYAGKSKFVIGRKRVSFKEDPRVRATPVLESYPR